MGESFTRFVDALQAFGERLAAVRWEALAVAALVTVLNYLLRTYAWRNIIAAAYPEARVRWRWAFGAYTAGIAVNSILPARAGDPVKLVLMHRRVEGASYATLAATLVAETLLDAVVATVIIVTVWQAGLLPFVPDLPELPTFELGIIARHPLAAVAVLVVLLALAALGASRARNLWRRVRQGLVILTTPGRYVRQVAVWQLLGWGCRLVAAWFYLEAFHIPPSLEAVFLIQVASSAATLMPATPGGIGTKQALVVLMLGAEAARADVLAYSVGQEIATTVVSVSVGLTSLALMLGGLRLRRGLAGLRRDAERETAPPAAEGGGDDGEVRAPSAARSGRPAARPRRR